MARFTKAQQDESREAIKGAMGFHLAYNLASMGGVGFEGFTHEWF